MRTTRKLRTVVSDELLDREPQLTELARRWQAVQHGVGQLVLVSGEAGAGKTALLRRFWAELDSSTRVFWSACDSLATPRPLGPLLEIGRAIEGAVREQLAGGGQPYDVADALITEFESFLSPGVLVVEDVHWADDATLDVLRILARRVEQLPALFALSFRDEELSRFHPLRSLIGDLAKPDHVTRIDAPALTRSAVGSLAEGSGFDTDALHALTGGNAFFVTETLAAGSDGLPGTVRDAVLARAARLSPDSRALLDAAAIVPDDVEQWLLEALAEVLPGALEDCLSAGMLRFERDRVAFRHELARRAVEESVPPDVRLDLHRRALAALADPPGGARDLARLAYHAEAAADTAAVLEFAPIAAVEAASMGAHTEAQDQYGRALRFGGALEPKRRAELLESFAEESYLTDMREGALDAISEAIPIRESSGEGIQLGRDLHKRASLLSCMTRNVESFADTEAAVHVLEREPPGADLAAAWGTLSAYLFFMGDQRVEEARSLGERAIALAESLDDQDALSRALANLGLIKLFSGEEAGRALLERSLEFALEAGDGPRAGHMYIQLTGGLCALHNWRDVDAYAQEGVAHCRARGLDAWEQCLLANRMLSELGKGEWDRAGETAASVLATSPEWHAEPRIGATLGLGLLHARRGDPGAWEPLNEALEAARSSEDITIIAEVAGACAEARWLEGNAEGVAAAADEGLAHPLTRITPYAGTLACWRRRAGLTFEVPPGSLEQHRLQLVGEGERAAAIWREANAPYDVALALIDSDRVEAWHEALDLLTELAARPAAAIVSRRLREAGERGVRRGPRPRTREHPMGLTERQVEVLELLVQGMRNGEIAERLVLSRKTVDHHVSAILGKLDARGRGEASAKAIELGIVAAPGAAERLTAERA